MKLIKKVIKPIINKRNQDSNDMASGIYFIQLNVDGFTDTQKLMLIK